MPRGDDESGIYLPPGEYPKAPRRQPSFDEHEHKLRPPPLKDRIKDALQKIPPKRAAAYAATALVGGIIGWIAHPDGGGGASTAAVAKAEERAKTAEAKVATLEQEAKAAADKAGSAAAAGAAAEKTDEAKLAKLAEAVGSEGEVTSSGGEIRLELVDKILFSTGEADLTPKGKAVLARVGKALDDIKDKQIWVQGHTDDVPIVAPKPPAPAKGAKGKAPAKGAKGKTAAKGAKGKAPAGPPAPPPRFATNWELSSARALTVVHYLQDRSKIDPTRLAAVAFGQYRPAGKSKARNRRIEIVLYPRHSVAPTD